MKQYGYQPNNDTNLFEVISEISYGVVPANCHLRHKLKMVVF